MSELNKPEMLTKLQLKTHRRSASKGLAEGLEFVKERTKIREQSNEFRNSDCKILDKLLVDDAPKTQTACKID